MATLDADREQRLRETEDLDRERRYWEANRGTLQENYPEYFVAVQKADGEFLAAHTDFNALLGALERLGVDPTAVWYAWIRAADKLYHV